MFAANYTLSEVAQKGTEAASKLRLTHGTSAPHAAMLAQLAERAVALHPAGNTHATSLAILKTAASAADALAALEALR